MNWRQDWVTLLLFSFLIILLMTVIVANIFDTMPKEWA